jgi:hypothetical protein
MFVKFIEQKWKDVLKVAAAEPAGGEATCSRIEKHVPTPRKAGA